MLHRRIRLTSCPFFPLVLVGNDSAGKKYQVGEAFAVELVIGTPIPVDVLLYVYSTNNARMSIVNGDGILLTSGRTTATVHGLAKASGSTSMEIYLGAGPNAPDGDDLSFYE